MQKTDKLLNDINHIKNTLNKIITSRKIEEKTSNLIKQGKAFFLTPGAGHEAIQIAVTDLVNKGIDWLFPYYRDLALMVGLGISEEEIFLNMLAKADDQMSGGKQMPCHWGSKKLNIPTQSSSTGMQFLQAVGVALANKKKNNNAVVYVSSGEGTTSQGEFHEAINWASREKLPVIFLIENNKWAISVPASNQSGGKNSSIIEMMKGYENLLRLEVDGTNYFESYKVAEEAFQYARSNKGPVLVEAHVIRLSSHSSSDDQRKYKSAKEIEDEQKKDPISILTNILLQKNKITSDEVENVNNLIKEKINKAASWALQQKEPAKETATKFILDETGHEKKLLYNKLNFSESKIVMVDAINHALSEEMELNEKIYLYGEDVADGKGGVFTATKGLSSKFGNKRVFNSQLAEASIVGTAIGMALTGLKPVIEIQFGDYIWTAFMQIRDELATYRYRSNNHFPSPVVIRVPVGGYIHGGLFHSQNIEGFFAHIPGIHIAYPSNAADAKGLLKTAIRLNDPVLFLEHKGLYRQAYASTKEPNKDYLLPFGKANIINEGEDLTVITYGAMVHETNFAMKKIEQENKSIELIDIRTIAPLDTETIFNSIKKTNRAVVIHEDTITAGFGAEIVAQISEKCFEHLDAPIKRIAGKDSFIPYNPNLENEVLPNRNLIYNELKKVLEY